MLECHNSLKLWLSQPSSEITYLPRLKSNCSRIESCLAPLAAQNGNRSFELWSRYPRLPAEFSAVYGTTFALHRRAWPELADTASLKRKTRQPMRARLVSNSLPPEGSLSLPFWSAVRSKSHLNSMLASRSWLPKQTSPHHAPSIPTHFRRFQQAKALFKCTRYLHASQYFRKRQKWRPSKSVSLSKTNPSNRLSRKEVR